MSQTIRELTKAKTEKIVTALKDLFEQKHLYQSIEINTDDLRELIRKRLDDHRQDLARHEPTLSPQALSPDESVNALSGLLHKQLNSLQQSIWTFEPETHDYPGAAPIRTHDSGLPPISLPSIRVSCGSSRCKGTTQPHNSGYTGLQNEIGSYDASQLHPVTQVVSIPYECQNCKEEPVVFLVKRSGLKLTLVGRSQFPEVVVPKFIPQAQQKFYRNAIIADQTNFSLAAALYLRTLVEQHFYQVVSAEEIKAIKGNPTGDELADLYAKSLPKNFPANFPSLKKVYDDLSKIVHSGKEDDETKKSFQTIRLAVEGHFEAVQLFKRMPAL